MKSTDMSTAEKFIKPKRAIDHLPGDPFGALEKVWDLEDVALFLHDELRYWFYMVENPVALTPIRHSILALNGTGVRGSG